MDLIDQNTKGKQYLISLLHIFEKRSILFEKD